MTETNSLLLPRRNENPNLGSGSIFFVGNATVLIRYAGFTILTDPNFLHAGDHVHLGYGLTSVRRTDPALELEDLPPFDFVLLSHLHGDHFDRVAERRLNKAIPIISTRHATSYLGKIGFTRTHALKMWEPIEVTKGEASAHKRGVLRVAPRFRDDPQVCHDLLPVRLLGTMRVYPGLSCLFRYLLP